MCDLKNCSDVGNGTFECVCDILSNCNTKHPNVPEISYDLSNQILNISCWLQAQCYDYTFNLTKYILNYTDFNENNISRINTINLHCGSYQSCYSAYVIFDPYFLIHFNIHTFDGGEYAFAYSTVIILHTTFESNYANLYFHGNYAGYHGCFVILLCSFLCFVFIFLCLFWARWRHIKKKKKKKDIYQHSPHNTLNVYALGSYSYHSGNLNPIRGMVNMYCDGAYVKKQKNKNFFLLLF